MSLIKKLSARLQNHPKRVVFPDGNDSRVMQAARQFATRKLGVPILVGKKSEIEATANKFDVRLDGIKVLEPALADDFEAVAKLMGGLPKFREFPAEEVGQMAKDPLYFASMMLVTGRADAMVAGARSATSSTLRQLFQIVPLQRCFNTASSMMIISTDNPSLGVDGEIFLADCGVIAEPTEEQLSEIAITTAILVNHLTLETPRVAMLGYSSKSDNSKVHSILKMKSATFLAREKAKQCDIAIDIDGELQVDAALSSEIAKIKGLNSSVAGRANVLIFPDLNSGNIASRILRIATNVSCYGQILTGLTKPAAELSRGATVAEIFATAVIVGAQSVDRKYLSTESI